MAEFPAPTQGIVLTHFIVASDVDRTRRFYADVLGGEILPEGEPSIVALANSWIAAEPAYVYCAKRGLVFMPGERQRLSPAAGWCRGR